MNGLAWATHGATYFHLDPIALCTGTDDLDQNVSAAWPRDQSRNCTGLSTHQHFNATITLERTGLGCHANCGYDQCPTRSLPRTNLAHGMIGYPSRRWKRFYNAHVDAHDGDAIPQNPFAGTRGQPRHERKTSPADCLETQAVAWAFRRQRCPPAQPRSPSQMSAQPPGTVSSIAVNSSETRVPPSVTRLARHSASPLPSEAHEQLHRIAGLR